ncbi:hypothetical protein Tco_0217347 [Tanacetum coccineum]
MSDSSFSDTPDLDDQSDIELITKAIQYEQSLQQQQAESSRIRNPIFRERDVAKALRPDATGQMSFSVMKCTSVICQLAYDTKPDAFDEYLQMGERSGRECLNSFSK